MKALKYYRNSENKKSVFLAASLATAVATALGSTGVVSAQSDTDATAVVDTEACLALSDSTALDQDSIKTRMACYSRDVEHLNGLVNQLMSERSELAAGSDAQAENINEFKQELATRQDAMQRLEERAADLNSQIDAVTAERDQIREQLLGVITEGKDPSIKTVANQTLFERFSESYVSQTNEIEELRQRLQEFENSNTELSDQQLATDIENQTLQSENEQLAVQITTLEESVAGLEIEKQELQANLTLATDEIETIKSQLLDNAAMAEQRIAEITALKASLDDSEAQRAELEGTIASLNDKHLQEITDLTGQADKLNSDIDALNEQQLALQEQSKQASDESQAVITARDEEIAQLASDKQELNTEREKLIADIASLEESHLQQTKGYQDQAGKLEEQIASISSEKTELDALLKDQQAANEELKDIARKSNDKSAELNLAANELREKLDAADAQAVELQANIDELGQQSADDKAIFSEQVANLNAAIEQNQQERDSLAAELDTVKPQLQTAEDNLRDSEEQNNELVANVSALEQKLSQVTEEQETLKVSLLDTEKRSMEAADNLASLKENAETLTSLLSMSRAHSKNADAALEALRSEMSATDSRLQEKQSELDALLAEKTRIENNLEAMASKARSQAQAIEQSLAESGHDTVKVAVSDNNNIGILLGSGQLFRTGSSGLSTEGQTVLADLASSLNLADDQRIMISGHSDDVPLGAKLAELYNDNWGLSMARALATANFFVEEADLSAARLTVSGFGSTQPIADNETEEGRQQNRRVEISIVAADQTITAAQ